MPNQKNAFAVSLTLLLFFATAAHAQPAADSATLPAWLTSPRTDLIKNFYGEYTEQGVLTSKVPPTNPKFEVLHTKVWYERPMIYTFQFQEPARFKDSFISFDGSELQVYYKQVNYAIDFKGIPAIRDNSQLYFTIDPKRYTYKVSGRDTVAGLAANVVTFSPKPPVAIGRLPGSLAFYEAYSFPTDLKLETGVEGFVFERRFQSLTIIEDPKNRPAIGAPGRRPSLQIPPGAKRSDWDLSGKGLDEADVRKVYPTLILPKSLPPGYKFLKIAKQTGEAPAFAALYAKEGGFLVVVFHKDFGPDPKPDNWGVFTGSTVHHDAQLTPLLIANQYTFAQDGLRYVLFGTLDPEDMIAVGDSITKTAIHP